jgi:cystathionine beta-lyase/cystathionine gamma-synthase
MGPPDREGDDEGAGSPDTGCARGSHRDELPAPPLAPPLYTSAVYRVADLDQIEALYAAAPGEAFIYARDGHPNGAQFAAQVAELEGAESGLACGSGMAAESAVLLTILGQRDHVLLADGVYGRTAKLVLKELARFGIASSGFDPTDAGSAAGAITERTKLIFVETISNPRLRVADLEGLAALCRPRGIALAVDHTFAPLLCRPLELGADFVIHSATKLIGGHGDVTLGVVVGSEAAIAPVRSVASTFGLSANPFDCWLAQRGLATLPLRARRASENAAALAGSLAEHPAVTHVDYPGLPGHPDHARARSLFRGGFGNMVTIDVGGHREADALIRALAPAIPFAPSLGDVRTTLSHPASTSHRGLDAESWRRQGITPGLIRISVGIEDPADLRREFSRALDAATA